MRVKRTASGASWMVALLWLQFGCNPSQPPESADAAAASSTSAETPALDSESPEARSPEAVYAAAGSDPGPSTAERSEEQALGPSSLEDGREPDPSRALPAISARHIGMHIGGESNAPEAKAPWLSDLEQSTLSYLHCYRLVESPLKGGTFGADLYIGRGGGEPEVRGMRQKLGGEDFEQCMKAAFLAVDFHRPARPTVFSYSMRFDVKG